jgi:uncharacterized membrane protein YqjE
MSLFFVLRIVKSLCGAAVFGFIAYRIALHIFFFNSRDRGVHQKDAIAVAFAVFLLVFILSCGWQIICSRRAGLYAPVPTEDQLM